jgi:pimeloyl-ACP methyl ester carboxylesterase
MGTFDLHVERSGGPGPTVVFVHGGAVDLRLFEGVVSLLGARRSCVRYDRRGLGRSRSAAPGGSHLGDLVALLEGLGPATVVGSSVGGAIALAAAVERASLVSGLVLLGPLLIGAAPPPGVLGRLGDIQVPTVVLVGSEDDPATIAGAETVASGVPRGELRRIERAGHMVEIVRPDEVARAILSD